MSAWFELERYGAWSVNVRRADVSIRPDRPLFFWVLEHDDAGHMKGSFSQSVDEAFDAAKAELAQYTNLAETRTA